jgi:hypothetical protein
MSEQTLPGGNAVGAARIDGVVYKQASPWTAKVHALLRHLEDAGLDGVRAAVHREPPRTCRVVRRGIA